MLKNYFKMANLYKSEEEWKTMVNYAGMASIIFAVMGLIGLVTFTTSKRTKEIGIRKVLGVTSAKIIILIVKEFALLISMGFILAIPVVYFFISKWLEEFPYKAGINSAHVLLVAALLLLLPALVIFSVTLKTANSNPVKSLRYE